MRRNLLSPAVVLAVAATACGGPGEGMGERRRSPRPAGPPLPGAEVATTQVDDGHEAVSDNDSELKLDLE